MWLHDVMMENLFVFSGLLKDKQANKLGAKTGDTIDWINLTVNSLREKVRSL